MNVFTRTLTLPESSIATLWTLFGDTAGRHVDSLGLSAERWPDLMWFIVRQRIVFYGAVPADRPLTLRTWMGPARHDFFPRHYALYDGDMLLCRAAAVWAMVDVNTRTFGKAPQAMYNAETHAEPDELPRLTPLRAPKEGQRAAFDVVTDYIDENGHMNNACYFRAVDGVLPAPAGMLQEAQVDYIAEALLGDTVDLLWQDLDGVRTIVGRKGDKDCFRMKLRY